MVNIKINGMSYEVAAGSTILEAAREAGIDIPTLCFLKDVNQIGACRMCMVEVKGAKSLVAACVYPVNEGMEVFTITDNAIIFYLDLNVGSGSTRVGGHCKDMAQFQFIGEETQFHFGGYTCPTVHVEQGRSVISSGKYMIDCHA